MSNKPHKQATAEVAWTTQFYLPEFLVARQLSGNGETCL